VGVLAIARVLAAVIAISCGGLTRHIAPDTLHGNGFPRVGALVFADDGSGGARALWGSVDCQDRGRVFAKPGGDPEAPTGGARPGRAVFRKLRVLDGDDFWGERCELGRNDHPASPVALYYEGMRRITYLSLKLSDRFPLGRGVWQTVMQMKETQPYDVGGVAPMINLQVFDGLWRLYREADQLWSAPAVKDQWTRLAFDVTYSTDPRVGSIRVYVDRNGDGDALDPRERSPEFRVPTLRREGPGTDADGLSDGDSIPSHLRVGIYHDPSYRCDGFRCSLGIDDVDVYEPHG
jgi:hypothetical protein